MRALTCAFEKTAEIFVKYLSQLENKQLFEFKEKGQDQLQPSFTWK